MSIRKSKSKYNEYMRKYHKRRYYKLRNMAIEFLGGKCKKCGSVNNLELDHIDKTKKEIEVSRLLSVSLEKFWNEVKKCQLLCKECHADKTINELGKKKAKGNHGTISSYRYCKCELCKMAKSINNKKYKLRSHS